MSLTDSLLTVATAYCRASRCALGTASTRALNDGSRLRLIEAGAGITVRRAEATIRWFSDNWPTGKDELWPADVPRPAPAERAA